MGLNFFGQRAAAPAAVFDIVHADILGFFPDLVRELGGDPASLLAEVGLRFDEISGHISRFGYRQHALLLEHAAASLRCPDFGMRLATLQGGSRVFGAIGGVMKNSKTFGQGLDYVTKHAYAHNLAARIRLERHRGSQSVFVAHDILLDRLPNRSQLMEQLLALGNLNAIEITGGQARVRRVLFRHHPLSAPATYRRVFGCEVRFDQQADGVVFSEQDLLCPILAPDPQVYARVTSFIDAAFTRVSPPMHAQVRGVILRFIGTEFCNNDAVSAELNLHPRTMHRRLSAEGTSFQTLKDEVRRDLTLYYLQQTGLSLTQIAGKLGYAEHSVFTRNCTRWFAVPPSRVRAWRAELTG